eukprot:Skav231372  [mRNA]  locus=scaffold1586:726520:733151:- [translate_table: standard]
MNRGAFLTVFESMQMPTLPTVTPWRCFMEADSPLLQLQLAVVGTKTWAIAILAQSADGLIRERSGGWLPPIELDDALELYTTNAACRSQYCVNPVYPGLQDLPKLEKKRWAKFSLAKIAKSIDF